MEERRGAAILWCVQGDAAAGVEVEDEAWRRQLSSGATSTQGRRRSEEAWGGMKETLGPIYKANG